MRVAEEVEIKFWEEAPEDEGNTPPLPERVRDSMNS